VLWDPAFFGVKPALVLLGGTIATAPMGDPNASIPDAAAGALPADVRRLRQGYREFLRHLRVAGGAGRRAEAVARRGQARMVAVENTRGGIGKRSMVLNDATPHIEVDTETYEVRADGELLTCEPATVLPMAQRYFLF
jgi:urease subunit alpha